ncbi:uncharacterized protein LOC123549356 [Mercenaria mercenaria]|uniref:uncharacterized protein LOC123549356 n=1 Tax=Mercenaria mercenaria TaxID=6596 RepID=UPI00234F52C1|nr:uncharacterized protein LOC123549356 [Mercenaria mercenaria]
MSKTPRTLLENYLDASKTQTVKVRRNQHVGLVRTPPEAYSDQRLVRPRVSRTPEPYTHSLLMSHEQHDRMQKYMSKTPEPYMRSASKSRPQHDRVSTLRSKRRSVSNNDVEETPRQLLQGFLESEDTTAPLVRYASRTSQGRLSSSQPALPVNSGRSSLSRPGNWAFDLDSDTPRTLLQKYVLNTTDVIDTPGPREGLPEQHSPDIPIQHDTYHTPSPFRTSSSGSQVVPSPRSARGKTPRSARRKEKFQMSMMDSVNQEVDESIIPPTNPADYQVPSPFRSSSSDEESFVPETQPSMHRTLHHKGQFEISIPEAVREEISQYRLSQKLTGEKVNETRSTESRYGGSRVSDSENDTDYDDEEGTKPLPPSQTLPGTSLLPDWEEYTMPLKGNEMDKSPVISDKSYHNSSLQEGQTIQQDGRYQDHRRMGRWSEGHHSRLQSPGGANRRSSESQRRSMPSQMTLDKYFSPRQNLGHYEVDQLQGHHDESEYSAADGIKSESRSQLRQHKLTSEMIATLSSGQIDKLVDELSPARKGSYNEDVDELYTAQKLEISQREKLHQHSLPNISGNFSPRITSTQRNATMNTHVDDNDILPAVTPSPIVSPRNSPRSVTPSSSTRTSSSRVLMPSNRDNQSTSVSPASSIRSVSSRNSSRQSMMLRDLTSQQTVTPVTGGSRNMTPGSSARQSRHKDSTPLQTVTPSPVLSSGASNMIESPSSLELKPSSRKSQTPESQRRESRRLKRSRSSQNRSMSMVQTPSKSVPASPVVAARAFAPDMVHTLPNNTVNFSPQIASTQNMASVSRVGQDNLDVNSKTNKDTTAGDDHVVDEDGDRDTGDDGQWQDEMDEDHRDVNSIQSQQAASSQIAETVPKRKKVERKPRQKSNYSLPVNLVKKRFTHFAGMRVSKEAVEEVMKVSEKYWDILARDLEAYAKHAGRKQINMSDFVLLFKRQGYVTEKQSLKSLIEKYLPMEEREKLIPVARAGNRIEPKL